MTVLPEAQRASERFLAILVSLVEGLETSHLPGFLKRPWLPTTICGVCVCVRAGVGFGVMPGSPAAFSENYSSAEQVPQKRVQSCFQLFCLLFLNQIVQKLHYRRGLQAKKR